MKIIIDKEKCIGCASCAGACPDVFEMGEDGKAQVKKDANLKADCLNMAISSCAVDAIYIEKPKK